MVHEQYIHEFVIYYINALIAFIINLICYNNHFQLEIIQLHPNLSYSPADLCIFEEIVHFVKKSPNFART